MKWYELTSERIEQELQVSLNKGLQAKQVARRQKDFGRNVLEEGKQLSKWLLLIRQFQDFMVMILLAATLVAGLLGEYVDAIAIIIIVLINGFIGFFQEQKAEKSLDKLKDLASPMANVKRDGKWEKISSKDVVAGDVVRMTSGDRIPADVRIMHTDNFETEESPLTGESLPVMKHASPVHTEHATPQDQTNMAFMGTLATKGHAKGIVVGTGMKTVMGQIANLMATTERTTTPLEYKLQELGKVLITVALFLTALVVGVGIYEGHAVYNMFLSGVSLAVAAIPEGLPAIVTVALSLGVQRMIRKKAVVRKLSAVETLGCASVICSDKTGTMTENQMTVKELFINNQFVHVTGDGYDTEGDFFLGSKPLGRAHPNLESLLLYGLLCNNAQLMVKKGRYFVDGDPTEGALLVGARKMGLDYATHDKYRVLKEIPFDSDRKRMSVIVEDENKMQYMITKGAPEVLLPRCSYTLDKNGRHLLSQQTQNNMEQAADTMGEKALRTIALGVKPLKKNEYLEDASLETELTFVGMFGMMDPPRREVKSAVRECADAGIKTVMITGDHEKTARAVAENIGLLPPDGRVLNGSQLSQMSKDELEDVIDDIYVFSRVSPEHKLKIVNSLQDKGHVVAMTGDGVNDAPAIKASDIGVGMGITGTDVTKEASSLVLMDDNFNTIKDAIEEGRNIYENIRKFIRYLLASNVGEILVMLFAILLAYPLPLVPVQILWVNLVTDGLPAMALGLDKPEKDVMTHGPRNPREGVFARGLGIKIVTRGLLIGVVSLVAFIIAFQNDPDHLTYARTIAFTTLVMAQLIHVFDCRSEKSVFARNPFENMYLVWAVLSSVLLLLVAIYWKTLQPVFHTVPLSASDWILILVLSAIPTVLLGYPKKS